MNGAVTEAFYSIVGYLGLAPWVWKSCCAVVLMIYIYRHERHWEHYPLLVGLVCVAVSPFGLPSIGPFGDWLVYPAFTIVLARGFYENKRRLDAKRAAEPDPLRVLFDAMRYKLQRRMHPHNGHSAH